jgi:hypothetical protein
LDNPCFVGAAAAVKAATPAPASLLSLFDGTGCYGHCVASIPMPISYSCRRRKAPLSVDGAQKLKERLGEAAKLPFPIHAHMLRHAAGYALAARGVDTRTLQAFMGHRSIANTVIYTAVADKRIRNVGSDPLQGLMARLTATMRPLRIARLQQYEIFSRPYFLAYPFASWSFGRLGTHNDRDIS